MIWSRRKIKILLTLSIFMCIYLFLDYTQHKLPGFSLLHQYNFTFKENIHIQPKYLLMILNRLDSLDRREMARKLWLNNSLITHNDYEYKFLIGIDPIKSEYNLKQSLIAENEKHNDILMVEMIDSYDNLTLKVHKGFEWFLKTIATDPHYQNVEYLIKADDDYLLFVDNLLDHLNNTKTQYYGNLRLKDRPERNIKNKNYVSIQEYKEQYYKPYATGPCYVLSTDSVRKMYSRSLKTPMMKNEDTYIGYLAYLESIPTTHDTRFFSEYSYDSVNFRNLCSIIKLFGIHYVPSNKYSEVASRFLQVLNYKKNHLTKC